jgi:hypothetical protein
MTRTLERWVNCTIRGRCWLVVQFKSIDTIVAAFLQRGHGLSRNSGSLGHSGIWLIRASVHLPLAEAHQCTRTLDCGYE